MSIETWIKEYYPVTAKATPAEDAVAHSIRKWEGLQPDALRKHGVHWVKLYSLKDSEGHSFYIGDTCALCERFQEAGTVLACVKCPLFIHRGAECSNETPEEIEAGLGSPWDDRVRDPSRMLQILREIPVDRPQVMHFQV
jgi:hypothetical protein